MPTIVNNWQNKNKQTNQFRHVSLNVVPYGKIVYIETAYKNSQYRLRIYRQLIDYKTVYTEYRNVSLKSIYSLLKYFNPQRSSVTWFDDNMISVEYFIDDHYGMKTDRNVYIYGR